MKRVLSLAVLILGLLSPAKSWAEETIELRELRLEKRFGFGFSAAGPLSLLGMEIDINVNENISVSGGIGTGLDYSTLMVKARYFLLGKSVSPYFGAGLARWWSSGTKEKKLSPTVLAEKFIGNGKDLSNGFNVFLIYPVLGVQFMHPMGLAVFAELQYLFKLVSLANGAYAGLGMHWYF